MIITKLYLGHFGKFCNKEIDITKGINVLYGENEAGKSTIHAFIHGMLFGIEPKKGRSTKEDLYKRYLPWNYPGAYDGRMDIIYENVPYQLKRSFHKNNRSFSIINLDTGREVELLHKSISDLIEGLTESTYKNTISIAQLKAKTDEDLANQLRNYITNLSVSRSNEVDVGEAVLQLNNKRKQIEAGLKDGGLKELEKQIETGLENEKKIDQLILRLKELKGKAKGLEQEKRSIEATLPEEMQQQMDRLPAILEKYKQFLKLEVTGKELDERYAEVVKKRDQAKREKSSLESIEAALREIEALHVEIDEIEEEEKKLTDQNDQVINKEKKRNLWIAFLPAALFTFFGIMVHGLQPKGIWSIVFGLLIAFAIFLVLSRLTQKKQSDFEEKMKQYMQMILSRNGRKRQLLLENNVLEYLELSNKHQRLLKQIYSFEYFEQRVEDLSRRRDNILLQTDELYAEILEYMQYFIPEEVLSEDTMEKLVAFLQNKKQHKSLQEEELNQVNQSCHLEMEKIRWELSLLEGNEETLLENQDRYEELLLSRKQSQQELEAIQLALSTIEELSVDIHDSFGQELNHVVNKMISAVTNGRYDDIKIDEKLNMHIGHNGTYININDLSAGTIDQIYFSLRIAVADLVLGKNEMPIILDDSFALYDDERVEAALRFLAKRTQILLFTCHKREEQLLEGMGLDHQCLQIGV